MSNYTKTTDFDVKDSLPSGDTGKIIRGSEFEVEFENIEVAIASKADSLNTVLTGNTSATNLSVTGNTTLGNAASDTVTVNADFSSDLLPSADATYDLGAPGSEWQDLYVTGTANVDDLSCGTASFSGDLAVDTDTLFVDVSENKVGIGTDAPATNLHVSDATEAQIYLSDTGGAGATSANSQLVFTHGAGNTNNAYIGNDQNVITGAFSMGTLVNYPMSFVINSSETMRIETSGNVGIGTSSPAANLDVVGSFAGSQLVVERLRNSGTTSGTGATLALQTNTNATNAVTLATLDAVSNNTTGGGYFTIRSTSPSGVLSERMRIDSSGNVGIGTSSPLANLEVSSASDTRVRIADSTNVNQRLDFDHNNGASFITAGNNTVNGVLVFRKWDGTSTTESMRIDADGNLGIGTSSPTDKLHIGGTGARRVKFNLGTGSGFVGYDGVNDDVQLASQTQLRFQTGASFTERMVIASNGNVGIGTDAPNSILELADDTVCKLALRANALRVGAVSVGNGFMSFNFDSGGGTTERMRIDDSGNLLVGTVAVVSDSVHGAQVANTGLISTSRDGAGTLGHHLFYNTNGLVGSISTNGSTTSYNQSSDVRLKENITDAPEGNVDALQVRSFDWKADGSHQEYGFIAQELEAVAPYAVTRGETEDDMWGVDYSKLVPMLVKEIQDLKARIATLEAN